MNENAITARPIPENDKLWGDFEPIAALRYTSTDLERRLETTFVRGVEDGLGEYHARGFVAPGGRKFILIQYFGAPGPPHTLILCLNDSCYAGDLDKVLESLDMDLSDLSVLGGKLAMSGEARLIPHSLRRQDDNGTQAVIGVFPCRASAARKLREFEASGHKQVYWIQAEPASTPSVTLQDRRATTGAP